MVKNIIKEIIIILLLTLAIILVLGVLLYGYIPANKVLPEKISYVTPESAKKELETDVSESNEELYVDYHIDSEQLTNYKKIQEYVPGRKNPFESLEQEDNSNKQTDNKESASNNTKTSNNTNNNQNSASNAQNNKTNESNKNNTTEENTGYLPNKGTK